MKKISCHITIKPDAFTDEKTGKLISFNHYYLNIPQYKCSFDLSRFDWKSVKTIFKMIDQLSEQEVVKSETPEEE